MHTEMSAWPKEPPNAFLVYAQKDEALKQEFEDYLAILQQNQFISGWTERQVKQGTDWSQIVDPRLLTANLIILMMSPRLLASGYCSGAEFHEAWEKNKDRKKAVLIPISLYDVNLQGHILEFRAFIPNQPISSWPESERQKGWQSVDWHIRYLIKQNFSTSE